MKYVPPLHYFVQLGLLTVILAALLTAVLAEDAEAAKRSRKLVIAPVSAEVCQQIRDAVAQYGVAIVEAGAAARGYTKVQIAQARAYCR